MGMKLQVKDLNLFAEQITQAVGVKHVVVMGQGKFCLCRKSLGNPMVRLTPYFPRRELFNWMKAYLKGVGVNANDFQYEITTSQVDHWLGPDVTMDSMVDLFCNIANGRYSVDCLRDDILEACKED